MIYYDKLVTLYILFIMIITLYIYYLESVIYNLARDL